MKKLSVVLIALLVVLGLGALSLSGSYNGLVASHATVEKAKSDVEVDLQRRYDLIPNVVNSVKGYMSHEAEVFKQIADARSKIGSGNTSQTEEGQQELSSAISRLLVLTENYPELKADKQVEQLIVELEGTENRIKVSRGDYNKAATDYNTKVRSFPMNLVAGIFGFEKVELYKADSGASTAPTVDLSSQR